MLLARFCAKLQVRYWHRKPKPCRCLSWMLLARWTFTGNQKHGYYCRWNNMRPLQLRHLYCGLEPKSPAKSWQQTIHPWLVYRRAIFIFATILVVFRGTRAQFAAGRIWWQPAVLGAPYSRWEIFHSVTLQTAWHAFDRIFPSSQMAFFGQSL